MKSPVKSKLMKILLDGEPHREIDLATGVGFTKVATIRKLLDSFHAAKFIERFRRDSSEGYGCRIIRTRETAMKIYQYPEFRVLRPEIRRAAWFCPLFTGNFDTLPDPLTDMVRQMAQQSHTFFEILCRYDSPEKIRETYASVLLLNHLTGIRDPLFNDQYLFYEIFIHAVIRDIDHGGLGSGFANLLDESQRALVASFGNAGRDAKRHFYSHKGTKRLL